MYIYIGIYIMSQQLNHYVNNKIWTKQEENRETF